MMPQQVIDQCEVWVRAHTDGRDEYQAACHVHYFMSPGSHVDEIFHFMASAVFSTQLEAIEIQEG